MRLLLSVLLCAAVAALPARAAEFALAQRWIHGAPGEPSLQVQAAAPGLWVLRQSKASNFEAPFLYLIAGERGALLLDTGAEPAAGAAVPLRATVDGLLRQWQRERGLATLPALTVAHTHAHRDHVHGDDQFRDRPDTRIVGHGAAEVAAFFGLAHWPQGEARFELGARTLAVLPLPGHEAAHIAVYDPASASLFTGDALYPGLLTVRDLAAYRAGAQRLAAFARTHRVERALGAHVEMSARPYALYPLGSAFQPDEHPLPLSRTRIAQWARETARLGDFLGETAFADFAFARVPPAGEFDDPPGTHGMLVAGTDAVYLSHLPMFHRPHDYQLILRAQLPEQTLRDYRDDARAHPDEYYTLAPTERWVLPKTIRPDARFRADLYRGHFERGGARIAENVEVRVARIVHFRRFEPGREPRSAEWIAFGEGRERFLAHRIESPPDLDQIVRIDGAPREGALLRHGRDDGALKPGDRFDGVRALRPLYTEYGDLAE